MRVRDPNESYNFSKLDLYKSFQIDSDNQMYLCASAFFFYIDWYFSLGHMSMDLSSVLAPLSSHRVPSATGTNIKVAYPQGCSPGLASPEPLGTLHGSRGYLNIVPAGPICLSGPLATQMEAARTPEVTILLPLCCATEALQGFPCSSPQCTGRATIGCQGGQQYEDAGRNQLPDGWIQPVPVDSGALYELGGTTFPPSITPLERFEVDLMDFEVSGSGEVPKPTRREQWASLGKPDYPREMPTIFKQAVG